MQNRLISAKVVSDPLVSGGSINFCGRVHACTWAPRSRGLALVSAIIEGASIHDDNIILFNGTLLQAVAVRELVQFRIRGRVSDCPFGKNSQFRNSEPSHRSIVD